MLHKKNNNWRNKAYKLSKYHIHSEVPSFSVNCFIFQIFSKTFSSIFYRQLLYLTEINSLNTTQHKYLLFRLKLTPQLFVTTSIKINFHSVKATSDLLEIGTVSQYLKDQLLFFLLKLNYALFWLDEIQFLRDISLKLANTCILLFD